MDKIKLTMERKRSTKFKYSCKDDNQSWKEKYDILDERYTQMKVILKKALTDVKDESEKHRFVWKQYEQLKRELVEKEKVLDRLRSVSEAVIDEYNILKSKYEMETEATNNALNRATKYCQENQMLKSKSAVLPNSADFDAAENESLTFSKELVCKKSDVEIEALHKEASDYRNEVACLKSRLQREIEKQNILLEDVEIVKQLYEKEVAQHKVTKAELQPITNRKDSAESENKEINLEEDFETEKPQIQSKLGAIEELEKRIDTTEKLLEHAMSNCADLETSLEESSQRAYTYERKASVLQHRIQELECQLQRISAGLPPPVPPPPPPPPPPMPSFNPIRSLMTFIHAGKKTTHSALKKEKDENPQQKAMMEMIDAIKKGNIHLKPTPKLPSEPVNKEDVSAVGEMKDILSSLKKRSGETSSAIGAESKQECAIDQQQHKLLTPARGSTDLCMKNRESISENDSHHELLALFRKKSSGNLLYADGNTNLALTPTDNEQDPFDRKSSESIIGYNVSTGDSDFFLDAVCSTSRTVKHFDFKIQSEKESEPSKRSTYNVTTNAFDNSGLPDFSLLSVKDKSPCSEKDAIQDILDDDRNNKASSECNLFDIKMPIEINVLDNVLQNIENVHENFMAECISDNISAYLDIINEGDNLSMIANASDDISLRSSLESEVTNLEITKDVSDDVPLDSGVIIECQNISIFENTPIPDNIFPVSSIISLYIDKCHNISTTEDAANVISSVSTAVNLNTDECHNMSLTEEATDDLSSVSSPVNECDILNMPSISTCNIITLSSTIKKECKDLSIACIDTVSHESPVTICNIENVSNVTNEE